MASVLEENHSRDAESNVVSRNLDIADRNVWAGVSSERARAKVEVQGLEPLCTATASERDVHYEWLRRLDTRLTSREVGNFTRFFCLHSTILSCRSTTLVVWRISKDRTTQTAGRKSPTLLRFLFAAFLFGVCSIFLPVTSVCVCFLSGSAALYTRWVYIIGGAFSASL